VFCTLHALSVAVLTIPANSAARVNQAKSAKHTVDSHVFFQTRTHRDGFREREALGHLSFGAPSRCDLFGRLSEKRERMHLLCVAPPQKSIFCCANFGSTNALNVQQKLKLFLHSPQEQTALRYFLGIVALLCNSEVLFVKFP